MKKYIGFTKMVASGNDFIVINATSYKLQATSLREMAKKICDRRYGVGADGVLFIEKSKKADIKMRIFNADGSEAEMCGNGARCVALWKSTEYRVQSTEIMIETKAGIIESEIEGDNVRIKLTNPKDIKLNIPIRVSDRMLRVNFVNTGVPHVVIFVEGLEKIDVYNIGRQIRQHKRFAPAGTNVNLVEVVDDNSIKIRTYERGVEDETLACGTGAVASGIIASYRLQATGYRLSAFGGQTSGYPPEATSPSANRLKINVLTRGGEILKVYFVKKDKIISEVWLEGKVKIVYAGRCYV